MRKAKLIGALAAVGLAACNQHLSRAGGVPDEILTPVEMTEAQRAAVQDGVKKALKDPESARFGVMRAGKDSKGVTQVCGTVNARNGFGGYAGFSAFIGVLAKSGYFGVGGLDPPNLSVVNEMCRRQGLDL